MPEYFINWIPMIVELALFPIGYFSRVFQDWWRFSRPAGKLLGGIVKESEVCKIFVRDLILKEGSEVLAVEPRSHVGVVKNVNRFFPEVEGFGIANIFSVLGQVGKTQNIEIVRMGEDSGEWKSQMILLGAQAQKHFDYYRLMHNVAYRMDGENIYNNYSGQLIEREDGYGYGIILKAFNPFKIGKERGIAFLIGGFGVLGTHAATYYFKEHYLQLGKDFAKDCFGIVIRVPITAGVEAVERIYSLDIRFKSGEINNSPTRIRFPFSRREERRLEEPEISNSRIPSTYQEPDLILENIDPTSGSPAGPASRVEPPSGIQLPQQQIDQETISSTQAENVFSVDEFEDEPQDDNEEKENIVRTDESQSGQSEDVEPSSGIQLPQHQIDQETISSTQAETEFSIDEIEDDEEKENIVLADESQSGLSDDVVQPSGKPLAQHQIDQETISSTQAETEFSVDEIEDDEEKENIVLVDESQSGPSDDVAQPSGKPLAQHQIAQEIISSTQAETVTDEFEDETPDDNEGKENKVRTEESQSGQSEDVEPPSRKPLEQHQVDQETISSTQAETVTDEFEDETPDDNEGKENKVRTEESQSGQSEDVEPPSGKPLEQHQVDQETISSTQAGTVTDKFEYEPQDDDEQEDVEST